MTYFRTTLPTRLQLALFLFPLALSTGAYAQSPQAADSVVVLEQHGLAGKGAAIVEHDGRFQVSASFGSETTWVRDLPARPNFLQAGNPTGTVVVGHLRNDGSPRWATVFTAEGDPWQPPGEVRLIHLSKQGDKVLAQLRLDGREETRVFDAAGRELDRFAIPYDAAHVTRFTARGDAVAVTPGPEDSSSVLEVFEIATGRTQRHEMDPAFPIEDAVALDADHIVVVGSGVLTLVLFPDAEEFSAQGPLGWSLRTEDPGYLTILGATADGKTLLATRAFGRFDLVGRDGRILWSFDPAESPLRGRLTHLDLGRFQPFLHADGTVELADDSARGRYLLSWPSSAGKELGEPLVEWEPARMAAGR